MRVFNAKAAAEDYMSTHSLAYSTPDMTLKKFAYWLSDLVDVDCKLEEGKCPNEDGLHPKHKLPRMMLYLESRDIPYKAEKGEVDETAFTPSGAVSAFYEAQRLHPELEGRVSAGEATDEGGVAGEGGGGGEETRFCFECGAKISKGAKFCPQCGKDQEAGQ